MKRLLALILLAVFHTSQLLSFPDISRHYTFDNGSTVDRISREDGVISGTYILHPDRFGNTNGAIKFSANSFLSTPSFFNNSQYQEGFSISFWINIEDNHYKEFGRHPWTQYDPIVRAFFCKKDNTPLLGFYRRADRAVIDRYTTNNHGSNANWALWMWDPVNFTQRTGWYHIVLSYEKSRMYMYVFYPNGQVERCLHYFGIQELPLATADWGIGNDSGESLLIDDFKVFSGNFSYEDARDLHAKEAAPNGMYKVSIAANSSQYMHTYAHQTSDSTPVELLQLNQNNDIHVYKWVFSPVPGQSNVYTIRMAYEDKYLHLPRNEASSSNNVEILSYDANQASSYQWYLEHSNDGYFYIRSNKNRSLYLHTVGHASSQSTRLEIYPLVSSYATTYKWQMHLLKTDYEINQDPIQVGAAYQIVLSSNTFLELLPTTPITSTETPVTANRGPYPTILSFWRFYKDKDDSYRVYNVVHPNYNLHPVANDVSNTSPIEAYVYSSSIPTYYMFTIDKKNPYGRRIILRPAINQSLAVSASPQSGSSVHLNDNVNASNEWALYKGVAPGSERQIYDLSPGLYRITSVADESKSVMPQNFGWGGSTNLVLSSQYSERYTSHYWYIDYERDANGNPVYDGTYTIKKMGTDSFYFHPKAHSLSNSTLLELYMLDRNQIKTEKWFIQPTRSGNGGYYIKSAGNPNRYVHLSGHSTSDNTNIELYSLDGNYNDYYSWKFVPVSIPSSMASDTVKIYTQRDMSKYLHVAAHSTASSAKMEILPFSASNASSYEWIMVKDADGTYTLQNQNSSLYAHLEGHTATASTRLEQYPYQPEYAPFYKWIIVPGTRAQSTYLIWSVANPSLCFHLAGHSSASSTQIEIYPFLQSEASSYEWLMSY